MKAMDEWNQFVGTGMISDYLLFKEQEKEEKGPERDKTGESLYAGFCHNNRHGIKDNPCR